MCVLLEKKASCSHNKFPFGPFNLNCGLALKVRWRMLAVEYNRREIPSHGATGQHSSRPSVPFLRNGKYNLSFLQKHIKVPKAGPHACHVGWVQVF